MLVFFTSVILFLIPFFWFIPGAVDLGGDGTRLYFYDPQVFFKNVSLSSLDLDGKGNVDPKHAYLIYAGFLAFLKHFIGSPYVLISLFNSIKIGVGFISIYFIVKEFINGGKHRLKNFLSTELSAVLAGIFYITATGFEKLIFFWTKALHSHDQIFLNPLTFFLLLRYFLTRNSWYLIGFVFTSFLFSTNFSMISAPSFFAFYPIALVFLLFYVIRIRKRKIPIMGVTLSVLLLLGLHAFHILPEIGSLFDTRSIAHSIVFKESVSGGVNFFDAVHGEGKAIYSLFVPSPVYSLRWTSFIAPLVVILGFIVVQRKMRKALLLTSSFFLVCFFLVTANITDTGLELYRRFFYIPGFSMFRHFFYQWAFIFIFFYALLFGQFLFFIFRRLKQVYSKAFFTIILAVFVIGFWPFLNGELVNGIQWDSNNVRTAMIMDPRYEKTLQFIRTLPNEGKILMLPLTDNFNQVVYGLNDAAYVGPSSISILTHKKSFTGYQIFYPNPTPETIMRLSREKKYEALSQIFSLFNIRYIFHNTDPKIYEEKFPNFPNSYMMTSMPKTQEEYKEFVKQFPVRPIYENGPFQMFEFDERVYRPEVYVPDSIYKADMLQKIEDKSVSFQSAFIDPVDCKQSKFISDFCNAKYDPPNIVLSTTKVNPTRYTIRIKQSKSPAPFLMIFQNSYHKGWKLSIDGDASLGEDQHVLANKYANAWVITEADRKGKTEYTVSFNLETQKYFIYGLWITGISFVVFMGWIVITILYKRKV